MSSEYSVTNIRFINRGYASGDDSARTAKRKQVLNREMLANMSDNQIVLNSIDYAEKKSKETLAGKISNALPMLFFVALPALFGAMQKGTLSDKTKSALSTAAIFAGSNILFDKFDNAVDRVANASPKFDEKRRKYPITSFALNIGGKALLLAGAMVGLSKGASYFQKKFQPTALKLSESVAKASEKMDSTKLAGHISKLSANNAEFMNKHPKIANFVRKHDYLSPLLLIFGWTGFSGAVANKVLSNKADFAAKRAEDLIILRAALQNDDASKEA